MVTLSQVVLGEHTVHASPFSSSSQVLSPGTCRKQLGLAQWLSGAKEVIDTVEKVEEKEAEATSKSKKTPAELAFKRMQEKRVS